MSTNCHACVVLVLLEAFSLCCKNAEAVMPQTQEEADAILVNITGNLSKRTTSTASTLHEVLRLVIRDASLQRLTSFEPNTSKGCKWPTCAAYCVPCAKTNKYWVCMHEGATCQVNSQCVFANCMAHPGYCYADAFPKKAKCFMGALPPRRELKNIDFLRIGAAPPVPLPSAAMQEWTEWAAACLLVPFAIFVISVCHAGNVSRILCNGKGIDCSWMPRSKHSYVLLTVICLLILVVAQVVRSQNVHENFQELDYEVDSLRASLLDFRNLTENLLRAKNVYNASLTDAAPSCGDRNPAMTGLISSLSDMLLEHFEEVHVILILTHVILSGAIDSLDLVDQSYNRWKHQYLYTPIIPLICNILVLVIGQGLVLGVWNSAWAAKHRIGIRVLRWCAPVAFVFMAGSAFFACTAFYVTILTSGYCLNIDQNLVEGAHRAEFSADFHAMYGKGQEVLLQRMAKYYLEGTTINPLATVLQNVQAALYTVKSFYKRFDWLVDSAALTCPGIKQLDPGPLVNDLLLAVEGAWDFFDVANIYPYYTRTVHTILCEGLPWQLFLISVMTTLGGMVMCPMIAIMASNHFRVASFAYNRNGDVAYQARKFRQEEVEEVDTVLIGEHSIFVEHELKHLTPLQQAIVLDRVMSRRKDVKEKLSKLQDGGETDSDSDSDSMIGRFRAASRYVSWSAC
eukprot:TRINITY_DN104988_c0_g1_i1.p1 TRINITY_DN104988_c0_g1~~TRINITY_DN104988_c0_g1_i1.p1  ORF type:complete len:683 (-),score=77.70 TRINITY_DN104988_c0_g1_i1:113-2161(-)